MVVSKYDFTLRKHHTALNDSAGGLNDSENQVLKHFACS